MTRRSGPLVPLDWCDGLPSCAQLFQSRYRHDFPNLQLYELNENVTAFPKVTETASIERAL